MRQYSINPMILVDTVDRAYRTVTGSDGSKIDPPTGVLRLGLSFCTRYNMTSAVRI